ncbi:MAG: prolyl oligopeptidase family serine peptidase, partial [Actinomycetota bacterium]
AGETGDNTGDAARVCRAPSVDVAGRLLAYVVDEAEVWCVDLDAVTAAASDAARGAGTEAHDATIADARRRLDDGRHEFCFDPFVAPDGATVSWQAWSPPDMPWDGSARLDADIATGELTEQRHPDAAVQQPRFTVTGAAVQVDDRRGWLNVSDRTGPVVAESSDHAGPVWGMGARSYAFGPGGRRVAFARNESGFGSLVVRDLERGAERVFGRGVHGHLDWVGDTIVAVRTGARTPTSVVAYDAASGDRTTLATSAADTWPLGDLPEPETVQAVAADGTTLYARRFAADCAAARTGRMLVWVHGGPTDQWQVDWRPRITYWWSRRWDVLVVDPRGTTGHGRTYQQALHGRWGRLDVDDTADLIRHAHASGWSTPTSTVVIGGSSGGLTVLGVLADHADVVAGGVASYPVSDLRALTDVTYRFEAHYTDTMVMPDDGSSASLARFRELSPLHRADRIRSPLLVFHGTEDPVVPIDQSRTLIERILAERPDADVELVEYDGEGHGFRDPATVVDEYGRTEAFLERVAG